MTETELIRSAQLGDRDAFAGLVSGHEKKLLALCWNMMGDRDEARDAAQEALLQAFENFSRFDAGRSFVKWLLGIGAKRCLDRLRRRRTFLRYFQEYARERGRPTAAPAMDGPGDGRAGQLLQKLSPRERAVVSLAVFEDCSAREIAAALGCSENTARVHLFNARVKLKREVTDGV
ncbi:MAG: sigma-70 family RNA polymerase sigma factor [Acidobacteriota bacterium]|jgi:RNA polymerase sigma-70 factor (ECF subfamily)|nr:sigma-70 family RNA polymerase sigma factor [Acidobacteriota bacterium]